MSTLNFPPNPQIGDIYTPPNGPKSYRWSGSAWLIITSVSSTTDITAATLHLTSTTNVFIGGPTPVATLIVDGGVYVDRDMYIGGFLYLNSSPVLTTSSFDAQAADGVDIDIVINTLTNQLYFNNISTLQSVTGRGNTTTHIIKFLNTIESTSTDTGAVLVSGGLGVGKRINSESIQIADTVFDSTKTVTDGLTTGTCVVDTYSLSKYRSAKYLIQIDEGTTSTARFQSLEMMLLATNAGVTKATEYGIISSIGTGTLGTFSSDSIWHSIENEWIVTLYFTPIDTIEKTIKVLRTAMTV
jgi:hypothetical protein